eukprot:CAMPEP_0184293150 /NCGR_PEP_ID=MMETSP1049-20130417/4696_1 /TAXON_ID=77928 /ORGANISM="Proteomonas sulcata, Strain CCMP704" /LENGTH=367 /DNA_ID=CAMNT_0026601083 /DNA_START=249 /DNA_END=1354 /DNA_ORIENTATION=-
MSADSPMQRVRESTARISAKARDVTIDEEGIRVIASEMAKAQEGSDSIGWDDDAHYVGPEEETIQYLIVVDAINFCFWPSEGQWEYGNVTAALKESMQADPNALDASSLAFARTEPEDIETLIKVASTSPHAPPRLKDMSTERLRALLGGRDMPNMEDRARLLREVGTGLTDKYDGLAANLVRAGGGSAVRLVELVLDAFPGVIPWYDAAALRLSRSQDFLPSGFRDTAELEGQTVFFYKRAQIFVGDVWGALKGKGLGCFDDIAEITMFADYRVPQILQAKGALKYSHDLEEAIMKKTIIPAGSAQEIEIRACTVQAVELVKASLRNHHGMVRFSIQVDWFLWEEGEKKAIANQLPPHHRTITTFY